MKPPLAEREDAGVTASPEASSPRRQGERKLPIVSHLDELRRRLWICLLGVSVASVASFGATEPLIEWLKRPAGDTLPALAFFSPPEAMLAYFKVAITAGLVLCTPLLLYELWAFVRPGLTLKERRYGLAFIWWGTLLFLGGVAFAYGVLLPVSLQFLLGFGGGHIIPVISISKYLSFTTMVLLACGAVFELPLAVALLARLGVVTPLMLRQQWRHAVVAILVAAALLTPTTDVATMVLLVVPMLALYELSVWVAGFAMRRRCDDG